MEPGNSVDLRNPALRSAPEARSAGSSLAGAEPVTLENAIELAVAHAPAVIQAAGNIRLAKASQRSALGAYIPTAGLSAGAALNSSSRFDPQTDTLASGSSASVNWGLYASWDVFVGGRRLAESRQAKARLESANAELEADEAQAAWLVERAFYEEERAQELEKVAQARVERALEGLSAAQRRASMGSATRSDVLRAQLELNTAQESLRSAQVRRHGAAYELGRLLGMDGPADAVLDSELLARPIADRDELVEELVSQAPSVRVAEMSKELADKSVSVAIAQFLPQLRLSAGYDWFAQDANWGQVNDSWSVRLGLSLPFFEGFRRYETLERAQVQQSVADAVLADTRRAVRAEAERVLSLLELESERIAFAEQAVEVASEDLRVQQERYNMGVGIMLDLLASQANLVEAQSALVGARFDYQNTRSEIEALAGRRL